MSNAKAMSLKAKIRNIAKSKNIPAQVILQNYMFERFLNRLSVSEYKEKFVLKDRYDFLTHFPSFRYVKCKRYVL